MIIKEINVKDVITKSNLPICDYSLNPYVGCEHGCRYCYACFMKRFTGHAEPWGGFIDVKYWEPLRNPGKYAGKEIFVGSVTDPYQPCEEKYRRTRAALEQLKGSGAKLSIATKSDLVLRDLDLIKSFPDARVSWSVNTLDDGFRADMDDAVPIERRLAAMKAFRDAGVRTTCFISPIFPGITDVKTIIERTKDICNLIWLENLNLRGAFKPRIMEYIAEKYPLLLPLYHEIYTRGDNSYWQRLDKETREYTKQIGLDYVTDDDSMRRPFNAPPVIVNYFYHSLIKKSAKNARSRRTLRPRAR